MLLEIFCRKWTIRNLSRDKGSRTVMFKNKKIVVVMPAYNAAKTLQKTYDEVMAAGDRGSGDPRG